MTRAQPKRAKSARTREKIVESALALFREHGYEATTMRMVADHAGVSSGNAYYYFRSKEELLQAFYAEIHAAHVEACRAVLAEEKKLADRLRGVIHARLEVTEPYHRFSGLLFRQAADPKSALNPFHEASREVREEATAIFAEALSGAERTKIPKDLLAELPNLLWTYSMGIVLFWIFDETENRARTRVMVDHTVDLVVRCIKLASNPLLRPLRRRTLALLEDLRVSASS